eukprot:TRINITY_DN13994_c0_g1_i1.p1 TRINITY_DN13994_c0_g1~~TRINITY_DN13994_c0_g1_i1.p1  ORF type:complete len:616 (-),score=108.01 TRINITY_DN13994_c0_g1_i1:8-1855(-)
MLAVYQQHYFEMISARGQGNLAHAATKAKMILAFLEGLEAKQGSAPYGAEDMRAEALQTVVLASTNRPLPAVPAPAEFPVLSAAELFQLDAFRFLSDVQASVTDAPAAKKARPEPPAVLSQQTAQPGMKTIFHTASSEPPVGSCVRWLQGHCSKGNLCPDKHPPTVVPDMRLPLFRGPSLDPPPEPRRLVAPGYAQEVFRRDNAPQRVASPPRQFPSVDDNRGPALDFQTGKDKYVQDLAEKRGNAGVNNTQQQPNQPRSLGLRRKFQPPYGKAEPTSGSGASANKNGDAGGEVDQIPKELLNPDGSVPERLRNIEPRMIEMICNEVVDKSPNVRFDDIAGLVFAKKCVEEAVVWPLQRPDLFTGLRGPPKGLLLFGPPGTGKTLIGKAIASLAGGTFFSISASSLMSKWIGDGEKMVRALFAVASCRQPAIVFIDEIDSLLSNRTEGESDAVRRVKTEFLVQLDGAATCTQDRILVVGATNRPQELDDAARRRLAKRLYIPLPCAEARLQLLNIVLRKERHSLTDSDLQVVVEATDGYSGSDLKGLCQEAALGPMRELRDIRYVNSEDVRPIGLSDFRKALAQIKASVSSKDLFLYVEWNKRFGSFEAPEDSAT